ncbi:hypothetical protein [Myxococcus sp. CA040A]|uniref:Vgb family protein n=1 Tax=Myxococcus sp. CA040A TaxID=2741738 RepID=UPI00157AB047|nr:hypothetical protein [Myxococcus sp. CA040A]NTX07237.1 hypothetical protein [Myxococcus sp. CA040A]
MRTGLIVLALGAPLLLGCGDSGDSEEPNDCPTTGQGTLEVTIRGLPSSTASIVTLRNGNGLRIIDASRRLEGLSAGTWNLLPEPTGGSGPLIRTAYDAPTSQVCVRDGQTATATVDYALVPSSQKLWLSTSNGAAEIEAFSAESLGASGSPSATVLLDSTPAIPRASGLAFDRRGNLWVALGSGEIRRYPARDLGASGVRAPDVTLTGSALRGGVPGPIALAFDRMGNLWVSVGFSDKVLRFGAAQLTASGSPTPEVELSGLGEPSALAFDAEDNLWVADSASTGSRVHRVGSVRLVTSGTVTPETSIDAKPTPDGVSFSGPSGLAFDEEDNLWVAYAASGIVARLTPREQGDAGPRTVTPAVWLDVGGPRELAFDEEGGLWLGYDSGDIARLSPGQLAATGAPTPQTLISSADLGVTHGVAIYPAPANLPLFHGLD